MLLTVPKLCATIVTRKATTSVIADSQAAVLMEARDRLARVLGAGRRGAAKVVRKEVGTTKVGAVPPTTARRAAKEKEVEVKESLRVKEKEIKEKVKAKALVPSRNRPTQHHGVGATKLGKKLPAVRINITSAQTKLGEKNGRVRAKNSQLKQLEL